MASSNPIYDTIEDEIVRILESGIELPQTLTLRLGPDAFKALLDAGIVDPNGVPVDPGTKSLAFNMVGHLVIIDSGLDSYEPLQ